MTAWAKPVMLTHKLKLILLAYLIATLNNYIIHAHRLHWLMSTGLLFQMASCQTCTCKFMTGEMVSVKGSKLAVWN